MRTAWSLCNHGPNSMRHTVDRFCRRDRPSPPQPVQPLYPAATSPPPPPTVTVPPNAGVYKIGQPYQVDNIWYYPREQPDYDENRYRLVRPTFYGHHTANGEMYDGNALTAAHKTLPMPVNVRVTESGEWQVAGRSDQ